MILGLITFSALFFIFHFLIEVTLHKCYAKANPAPEIKLEREERERGRGRERERERGREEKWGS